MPPSGALDGPPVEILLYAGLGGTRWSLGCELDVVQFGELVELLEQL